MSERIEFDPDQFAAEFQSKYSSWRDKWVETSMGVTKGPTFPRAAGVVAMNGLNQFDTEELASYFEFVDFVAESIQLAGTADILSTVPGVGTFLFEIRNDLNRFWMDVTNAMLKNAKEDTPRTQTDYLREAIAGGVEEGIK